MCLANSITQISSSQLAIPKDTKNKFEVVRAEAVNQFITRVMDDETDIDEGNDISFLIPEELNEEENSTASLTPVINKQHTDEDRKVMTMDYVKNLKRALAAKRKQAQALLAAKFSLEVVETTVDFVLEDLGKCLEALKELLGHQEEIIQINKRTRNKQIKFNKS